MNTLDAIIALLILTTSFGLLINSFSIQNKSFLEIEQIVLSKNKALMCATTIDSMYASSIDSYLGEVDCFVAGRAVKSKINEFEKEVSVIPNVTKEHFLEVDTRDHYK